VLVAFSVVSGGLPDMFFEVISEHNLEASWVLDYVRCQENLIF
jgi:hypothetical protein